MLESTNAVAFDDADGIPPEVQAEIDALKKEAAELVNGPTVDKFLLTYYVPTELHGLRGHSGRTISCGMNVYDIETLIDVLRSQLPEVAKLEAAAIADYEAKKANEPTTQDTEATNGPGNAGGDAKV